MSSILFEMSILVIFCAVFAEAKRRPRIFNGENARIEDHPYQISIEIKWNDKVYHDCGGSIISENYVLTAAHCAWFVPTNASLWIRVGTSFRSKGGRLHTVTNFIRHEEYDGKTFSAPTHDIAVVKVKEPFNYDDTCQPIKMFEKNEEATPGAKSVVTGFGLVSETENADQLQAVNLTIIRKEDCKKVQENLRKNQICAVGVDGKDTCSGDSGGPLVVDGRLAGVLSWSKSCGDDSYPTAFTEVARYRDWISKHVQ